MGDAMTRTKLLNHAGTWSLICALVLLDQTSIGATPAMAQTAEGRQIAVIVRKSEAGEQENGFCASTGWPQRAHLAAVTRTAGGLSAGSDELSALMDTDFGKSGGAVKPVVCRFGRGGTRAGWQFGSRSW